MILTENIQILYGNGLKSSISQPNEQWMNFKHSHIIFECFQPESFTFQLEISIRILSELSESIQNDWVSVIGLASFLGKMEALNLMSW